MSGAIQLPSGVSHRPRCVCMSTTGKGSRPHRVLLGHEVAYRARSA